MVHTPNDNLPSKISNINASQMNDIPQTSVELIISQAPSASLRSDARVGSTDTSASVTGLAPIQHSPDPWVMDASVARQEWTPDAISPHSEPSESVSHYDPNQCSRQNSQISGQTISPEPPGFTRSNGTSSESRSQCQQWAPRYSDHYSPPPTSATSSHHRHLEQNEARAYRLPIPPRPTSPMNSGRKRPAEHDNEDDNHYRNPRGLARRSPATETEWRRGRSISPELHSSILDRLRSPSPSCQIRPYIDRDALDRRGRNEGGYRPDYPNTADVQRPSDSGYSVEEHSTRCEERDPRGDEPSLLGQISTPGGRGNTNRGWGRGKAFAAEALGETHREVGWNPGIHKSATSFTDLHTINGHVFDTFHEAASDLGLFNNLQEGFLTLQEAVDSLRTPSQLRFLFAQILLEGYPATPLWEKFKDALSLDHVVRLANDVNGQNFALQQIDDILSHNGRHLDHFRIYLPQRRTAELLSEDHFLTANQATFEAERDNMCASLNPEQRHIFDVICDGIDSRRDATFFIEGRPGHGKMFMINALSSTLRAAGHIVLIVGSSALYATAYRRGWTAHYMFGIPVTDESTDLHSNIHPFSPRA
ncbi:hypothetical protein DFJ58DRAFT_722647 [Suillus subalutaceus]|uniref:uncharacterized protein n=1 Tax=Suillus subalutaceus TaxID=48586 RepID=UPI001B85BFA4|nr:uncharacterized protein DFJ58DRAFT_722647 [Suillus subalutaceus]KAG1871218.1 hypothetical protein DFJ58DRAFT_722647 [Suillus subalutaceus]